VLAFSDTRTGSEIGVATLYLQPNALAYYYYAFYDLSYYSRNLGMFMMTTAVARFAGRGFQFLYLGSCYLENALYKTQFAGAEFFNGVRWSENLDELKYLLRREQTEVRQHLLENEEYRQAFFGGELPQIAAASPFRVEIT
jgi:arginyl-tRNA--protein-N-Asp/Glu arginylyltransferase